METSTFNTTVQIPNYVDVDVIVEFSYSVTEFNDPVEFWGQESIQTTYEINDVEIISVTVDGDYLNDEDEVVFENGFDVTDLCSDINDKLLEEAESSVEL